MVEEVGGRPVEEVDEVGEPVEVVDKVGGGPVEVADEVGRGLA